MVAQSECAVCLRTHVPHASACVPVVCAAPVPWVGTRFALRDGDDERWCGDDAWPNPIFFSPQTRRPLTLLDGSLLQGSQLLATAVAAGKGREKVGMGAVGDLCGDLRWLGG